MNNSAALEIERLKEFTLKNWHLFVFITCMYLIISLVNDKFIMTREVYQLLLSDKMESYRIDDYYEMLKRFSAYLYLSLPLITWLKITFIAFLLQTPLMLKSIEISFKETFRIAVYANIPFIIRDIIKLGILFFTPRAEYTNELLSFMPGSITNFLSEENYSTLTFNFLSSINVYEALWIFVVFLGLARLKRFDKVDAFILSSGVWIGLTLFQFGLMFYMSRTM